MINDKIKQIKISRIDQNERYFYDLIQDIKIKKSFFWSKDFIYSVDGKCIFKTNSKNKTIDVLWDIHEDCRKIGLIDEINIKDFLLKMLKNYLNIENYEIKYFA